MESSGRKIEKRASKGNRTPMKSGIGRRYKSDREHVCFPFH